jgi:Tc5 transposase DNA-binding domain
MNRNIPLTSQIIKNLAEEILKGPVGKNWIGNFLQRHKERIDNHYLRPINRARVSAESVPMFEHFYTLVQSHFAVL